MTVKEAILAWVARTADAEGLDVKQLDFVIMRDGFVYALPKGDHDRGAVKWWPLPYLGVDGETAFANGDLYG